MVVKMMRWPWPPLSSRKFEVKVKIQRLEGLNMLQFDTENNHNDGVRNKRRLVVEIKWKGQKSIGLGPLRRSVKRNYTKEGGLRVDGVFEWNEEFKSVCNFSGCKEGMFQSWEVEFNVYNGLEEEPRNSVLVGTAVINLTEFASTANEKELEINLHLTVPSRTTEDDPLLVISLRLMELGTVEEQPQAVPSPSSEEARSSWKVSEVSSLRKVRIFRGTKKACDEEESSDSEDAEHKNAFNAYSPNGGASSRLSFNYETLSYANFTGGSFYSSMINDAENEDCIYYNNRNAFFRVGHSTATVHGQSSSQSSKRRILPWRKRKLTFRSAKHKVKGEPLLKKDYRENGGDDIDFDRRQLSSSDESSFGWNKSEEGSSTSRSSFSDFGDDHFAIGSWEQKEVISRDRRMKLQAQVFFASIDQRSERAAGESACTALVAVIANWLQSNHYQLPIKSEFDSLIRDGSSEWRDLCENQEYRKRFPDKHFDLETVLQAKIRPISVVAEKSFIGFFHPDGLEEGDFEFLHGAMSFDSIWEEISQNGSDWSSNGDPLVYIVSWNDHFFLLKVEQDAYYIIDTLGERLFEGCNQAYVLKFDKDTTIKHLPAKERRSKVQPSNSNDKSSAGKEEMEEEIVCRGKESCKDYIKSFLAAIPIRELHADIKKGLMTSTPIHHRLQIEFHYTQLTEPAVENSSDVLS